MAPSLLLEIALKSTAVLFAAWITARLLTRSSAAVRHLVWTAAFLGILVLPFVVLFGPIWRVASLPQPVAAMVAAPLVADDAPREFEASDDALPRVDESESAPVQPPFTFPAVNVPRLLVNLWAAGVMLALLKLLIGVWWASRITQRATRVTNPVWISILAEASAALRLKRDVPVLRSERTTVASTCGILRPRVLVPAGAELWDVQRIRLVLLHELAHVKRRDCLIQTLARISWALHWYNPLAHIAAARMTAEQERSCDDRVLAVGTPAPDYAKALVEMARAFRSGGLPAWSTLAMARPFQFGERVTAILDQARSRRPPTRGQSALIVVVSCCFAAALAATGVVAAVTPTILRESPTVPERPGSTVARIVPGPPQRPAAQADLVRVNASVSDSASGQILAGLSANDFQVFEDKVEQSIETFTETPLSIGLISSNLSAAVVRDLTALLKMGSPEDQYFLVHVKTPFSAVLLEDFTTDGSLLQNAITAPSSMSAMPIFDAAYLGLEKMKTAGSSRRALVLITDVENTSRYSVADVRNLATQQNVPIFAIGIGLSAAGRTDLEKLVVDDSNREKAFFIDSAGELENLVYKIADELRNVGTQYLLGYRSTNTNKDGNWRQIRVKVNRPPSHRNLTVRSKSGYYAPQAVEPGPPPIEMASPGQPFVQAAAPLSFEVATIKPWEREGPGPYYGGGGCQGRDSHTPPLGRFFAPLGRCNFTNMDLGGLMRVAFSQTFQSFVPPDQMIEGIPAWTGSGSWNVEARAEEPETTTRAQLLQMLQTLLIERFKLEFHRETREIQGFVLTVAKGGPKLKAAAENPEVPLTSGVQVGTYNATNANMRMFTSYLSTRLRVPVQDKTGLDGMYELHLKWTPGDNEFSGAFLFDGTPLPATFVARGSIPADPSSGSLFTALQEQLGLRLESQKVTSEILVVDRAEKPAP